MTKTKSINPIHDDDESNRNTFKTCENNGAAPWSDLNHDVLFVVMMRLGVIDFVSFSGVCKSWRSLALSNKNKFMASKPPMSMWISIDGIDNKWYSYLYLQDFEGRRFKTILPRYDRGMCVGFTCGYLILFDTRDFWLVNPITRHQLQIPDFPGLLDGGRIKAILVSSPSIPGLVLVVISIFGLGREIWVSIAGKGAWDHVCSKDCILDIQVFKGKIYTLNFNGSLYEMSLNPKLKLSTLEIKDFEGRHNYNQEFVSSGENLYVINNMHLHQHIICQLDFEEMKQVSPEEKRIGECVFLFSWRKHGVAIKPESWVVDLRSKYNSYDCFRDSSDETRKCRFFDANMWYFPHLCLDVDTIDE